MWDVLYQKLSDKKIISGVIGSVAVILTYVIFAPLATYILHNPWWVSGGVQRIFHYILVEGSIATIGGFFVFYLSQKIADKLDANLANKVLLSPKIRWMGTFSMVVAASLIALAV